MIKNAFKTFLYIVAGVIGVEVWNLIVAEKFMISYRHSGYICKSSRDFISSTYIFAGGEIFVERIDGDIIFLSL